MAPGAAPVDISFAEALQRSFALVMRAAASDNGQFVLLVVGSLLVAALIALGIKRVAQEAPDAELRALWKHAVANHDNRSLSASKANVFARRLRRLRFGGVETRVYEAVSGRPLGTVVWDGALLLCAHLARRASDSWKSKHVLELGSGTGLVGLALAQRGAAVTLTDLAPLLPLLAANARLNAPETKQDGASEQAVAEMAKDWEKRVRVRELDWTHELDVETTAELRHVDLVVGADLLYVDEPVFSALLRTLQKLAPAEALLAGVRRHKGVDEYLARLRDAFALESLDAELEAVLAGLQERKSNVEGGWSLRSGEGAYLVRLRARK